MKLVRVKKSACEEAVQLTVPRRDWRETDYVIPFLLGRCQCCGTEVTTDNGYADTEGKPWVDYYCDRCVRDKLKLEVQS